jgi:hypothetical protein
MELTRIIKETIQEYLNEQMNNNKEFIAYHGSGVEFDNFLDDFIGSGIGNAGFGYGIYLTDTKKNAKGWAKSLEKTANVFIDGVKQSVNIGKFLTNAVDLHGNKPELLLHILKRYIDNMYKENKITEKEYDFIKNSNTLKLIRSRFVYEVNVLAKDFIYWNEPIPLEQVEKVYKQAEKENKEIDIVINNDININGRTIKNGEDFYGSLKMPQKEKAYFLYRSGIDGVIFYENGENYVIFNPKNLSIKKKISF